MANIKDILRKVPVLRKLKHTICPNKLLRDISFEERVELSKKTYFNRMGEILNLDNPKLFTEKIRWYELFYLHEDMPKVVDKYLFKKYIEDKLGKGYTLPLFGMWTNIDDLKKEWDILPNEFVLKSNLCDNGKNIKVIHNKSSVDKESLFEELKYWFNPFDTLINSFCNAYYKTTPRIIAEEYCENVAEQLFDYKLFCFNGEPYFFYVASEHMKHDDGCYPISFYDLDWKKLDITYGNHPVSDMEKPTHLAKMIEIAKKLSKPFPFVRVDFFDTKDKLYMAEMTFYPGGGLTHYYPRKVNEEMGERFILPSKNAICHKGKFKFM